MRHQKQKEEQARIRIFPNAEILDGFVPIGYYCGTIQVERAMVELRTLLSLAIASSTMILLASCGPTGVTLMKPSNLVNYQYVTCFPQKNDAGALEECIQYYEDRGFVKQDQINMLQM